MPNNYFQFKQFRIEQDKCGMKVTTDGCYFGASIIPYDSGRILDIGTGTGLLSLMAAQRTSIPIDAIEINTDAFEQAQTNFSISPWTDQFSIYHTPLQEFQPDHPYDQIICNPPFFVKSQAGQSKNKNQALHADTLSMEDLAFHSSRLMSEKGELWVMYPEAEMQQFLEVAKNTGFIPHSRFILRNKKEGPVFREIIEFCKVQRNLKLSSDVYIKKSDGSYSESFIKTLKDFYLHL